MDMTHERQFDPEWSTAVPDWEERIVKGLSLIPDLPLFDKVAEKALRIFKRLKVPDMIGTPTFGEVCEQWVFDFVRAIFGSYNPETKERMLREFFLLVPKKNGKSAIAAGIILTAAILNERPQAELLLIAPSQKIAGIAFKTAKGMIELDERLSTLFHIQVHQKEITHLETKAVIMIVSADGDVVTGSKATYVLVDETHKLAAKPKAKEVFVEIRGGLASRPEGFFLQITTQSKTPPKGEFKRELDKARAVRDGEMKLPVLAVLYELPPAMAKAEAWRDPGTWGLVNPNLERSVSLNYLLDEYQTAVTDGKDSLAIFASQHLNVQIGEGLTFDRWVGAQLWADSAEEGLTLEEMLSRCEVVVAGIDGGGMDDLLGLTFVGRETGTKRWLSWSRAWVHKIGLERRQSIAVDLQDFEKAGELVICEHETQDIDELVALISMVNEMGLLPEEEAVGLDPEGVAAIIDALIDADLTEEQLQGISQGFRLNGAIKGTERKLFNGTLLHAPQAVMTWCVSNAKTELRGNAVVVTKAASGTGKIDPLMALFDAVALMARNPEARGSKMNDYFEFLRSGVA